MAILAAGRKIAPAALLGNLVALGRRPAGHARARRDRPARRRPRPPVLLGAGAVPAERRSARPVRAAPQLQRLQRGRLPLTTNSRGLRERELPLAKPPAPGASSSSATRSRSGPASGTMSRSRACWKPAQRQRRRPDRDGQHRRRRLQHDPGAGPAGAGRAAVRAGRGRADVRGERPAGDVLDLRPPVRADRRPWLTSRSGSGGTATSTASCSRCTGGSARSCVAPARARPSRSGSATAWRSGWRRSPR